MDAEQCGEADCCAGENAGKERTQNVPETQLQAAGAQIGAQTPSTAVC